MRWTWLGVMVLIVTNVSAGSAAANQVAPSRAATLTFAVDANALKPAECADLDLSAVVTTGTGTNVNELILGTGSGETLHGGGGDDCIVAGAGDDILVGGPGSDVCIGGPGRDSYDASCEVQVEAPPGVPDPPTALDAAAASSTSIALSWTDNADNEDGFAVERSPAGSGSWEPITTVAADTTTHTDTGLTVGAAYDYRLRAFNSSAYSTYSNVATASTVGCPAPGTTTVYADRDVFVAEEASETNFQNSTYEDFLVVQSAAGRNARTLVGFPLPVIPDGCEITSATLRLNSIAEAPGRTLHAYQAATAWTETVADWNDQPGTTGTAATTSSGMGWLAWSVTEQVAAMYTGVNHGFTIRDAAENAPTDQTQAFSSHEVGTNPPELVITYDVPPPPPDPPAAPSDLTATAVSGSLIDLSWADNADNEDGFTVERSPAGLDTWAEIATIDSDVTTHADTGVTTDTTYDYRVRAFNAGGTSTWSNTASATTGSCASPSTTLKTDRDTFVYEGARDFNANSEPYLAVRSASGTHARALVGFALPALPEGCSLTGATLRLNASQAATGRTLAVQRAAGAWTEGLVTWNTQPAPTGTTATTLSGLGWVAWEVRPHVTAMYNGANHGFVIRDAAESSGTDQNQIFANHESSLALAAELILTFGEPVEPPLAPSQLNATAVSGSRIELSWTDGSTNEDGFTIQRSPAGQNTWTEIATTDADATAQADTGVTPETTYDYRVRAFNNGGTSAWSNTASATTPAGCLSPGTQTVTADQDVYVAEQDPTINFQNPSSQGLLSVQSRNGGRNRRVLVRFELPAVPTGCTITEATLRLNAASASPGRTLLAYQAAATWNESDVTWNSQPATTGTAASTMSGTGWRDWAVITQVNAMYTGANHGFVISDSVENSSPTQTQSFSSREGPNPPELVITFG